MDLTALYLIALPAAMYLRAQRVLARRGRPVPAGQQIAWYSGLALIAVALLSPLDDLGETDLVWAHMGQHLLLADLSAPLLLIGLRTPVYAFMLPPSMLAPLSRSPVVRRTLRRLKLPWIAAGLWVLILYGWHFSFAYEAALRNPVVHALQHQSFMIGAILVWLVVLEPNRRRVPGELWKIAHIGGVRFAGMFLGMALVASPTALYQGFYGRRALEHGLSPVADQQIAGGLMLFLDLAIVLGALFFFFMRTAEDAERAERRAEVRLG